MSAENYLSAYTVRAAGALIGLATCRRCGATVILTTDDTEAAQLHEDWHAAQPDNAPRTAQDATKPPHPYPSDPPTGSTRQEAP